MNPAQLARFDRFFDDQYPAIAADVAATDPTGAVRRTRAGFASAHRFWSTVKDDGDPAGWIRRVIAEDRRAAGGGRCLGQLLDKSARPPSVDIRAEHRRVVALARRPRAVAGAVIGTWTLLLVAAELFVAHH